MRLLFDENLSPRLVDLLADLFPASLHVHACDLGGADDLNVWTYAKNNGLTIVTKDSDFRNRSAARGFPPKVIWLRAHNCSTAHAEFILRAAATLIGRFAEQHEEGCLILGHRRTNP